MIQLAFSLNSSSLPFDKDFKSFHPDEFTFYEFFCEYLYNLDYVSSKLGFEFFLDVFLSKLPDRL